MKLYRDFEEAYFVERLNRFVIQLKKKDGRFFNAYIANPGRMEEYLVADHPFFVTSGNIGKYEHRIVSTVYQDSYILLDTIKMNALVETMLKNDRIHAFTGITSVRREKKIDRSRFDFLIERENHKPSLLEVKSCSLCHRGVAMFPDAPTERGRRHLEDLEQLAQKEYDCFNLYLLNHKNSTVFMPNWHTDMAYTRQFQNSTHVTFLAYSINMADPVTLNTEKFDPVPIDFERTKINGKDKGSYLLVFRNQKEFKAKIGSIGQRNFKKGYYVYVGSAMQGLEKRIKRHLSKKKKIRWHIDYISPHLMKIEIVYPINRADKIEAKLAEQMLKISQGYVEGFGASDSVAPSHLFYFNGRPHRQREFLDLLLDARMLLS
jgi:sugar fermentation stimulation protein A